MAPGIAAVSDIRVPPIFITDHAVLDNFPELLYTKQGSLVTFSQPHPFGSSPKTIAISRQENISPQDMLSRDTSLLPDATFTEDFMKENPTGESPVCDRGEADDLFDSEYVLPDNCQWWQQVEDLSFEAPPCDFDVVDQPHFWNNLNYSGLLEDIDDDVPEERAIHETGYCLDTMRTTVWGLDIIWEEEE